MRSKLCILVMVLGLAGCVSGTDQDNLQRYSLIENISTYALSSDLDVKVRLLTPLERGGLVIKTSDVALYVATAHKWTSELDEQLRLLTVNELLRYQVPGSTSFDIQVRQLYGSVDGVVYISFAATVSSGERIFKRSYETSFKQFADGYDYLVVSLRKGYVDLVNRLAADLGYSASA